MQPPGLLLQLAFRVAHAANRRQDLHPVGGEANAGAIANEQLQLPLLLQRIQHVADARLGIAERRRCFGKTAQLYGFQQGFILGIGHGDSLSFTTSSA
ncbi:hypothetical protein D3C73_1470840 [compost metagenome]